MNNTHETINNAPYLCLFGIGVSLHDCCRQLVLSLGRKPDFMCDNDPEKWCREYLGIRCISPDELGQFGEEVVVVITVRKYEAIYSQLSALGISTVLVACFDQGYDVVRDIKRLSSYSFPPYVQGEAWPERSRRDRGGDWLILAGKWTFITGAARGIGRQIALEMARLGSHVILHSRLVEHTNELAESCSALGIEVRQIAAELSDSTQLEVMLDDLENCYPPIDILFNNAAISLPCGSGPWDISSQDYLTHFSVNTIAPIRICYRLIPPMIKRGFGRVINISSTIQKRPGEMAYACSKAALNKFVHDMAQSLEGTGVMMSLVCPGYVRSDMGGPAAPHPVQSVIPGALLGAVLDEEMNGRWFIAQDYAGLDLQAAIQKSKFYYNQE